MITISVEQLAIEPGDRVILREIDWLRFEAIVQAPVQAPGNDHNKPMLNQFKQEEIIKRLPRRLILLQEPQPSWSYQI